MPGAELERLCILIPTTRRYRWMAEFTCDRIHKYWRFAPPIYFCGVGDQPGEAWLPLENDPRDWIGIVDSAAGALAQQFDSVYLILDDHPPVWRCHERHLNHTLPRLLHELDAAYIGLNGWGPGRVGRTPLGEVLDERHYRLERVRADFRWKYSLHPGLWNLSRLRQLLNHCGARRNPEERTVWYFERQAGAVDSGLPAGLAGGAYRICGRLMSRSTLRYRMERLATVLIRLCGVVASSVRLHPVSRFLHCMRTAMEHYYEGPYPLLWSGVLRKGSINPHFLLYLACHGKLRYRSQLLKAHECQY